MFLHPDPRFCGDIDFGFCTLTELPVCKLRLLVVQDGCALRIPAGQPVTEQITLQHVCMQALLEDSFLGSVIAKQNSSFLSQAGGLGGRLEVCYLTEGQLSKEEKRQ